MSLAVTAFIFQYILAENGLLNTVLRVIPFVEGKTKILSNPDTAMWGIILMKIVRNTGYYSVFLFAGLKAIPPELYEVSRIDGASSWALFRYITLPLLKPIILFVLVMSTIFAFQLFEEPWLLLKGGPVNATTTLQIFLYQQAFIKGNFGVGAAASFFMAFMMIAFSRIYVRLFRES
jgi:ABC-type sugar transport system permease subunit